jgi:glycosyltransferase involved in cell wall biosynthesis
MKVCMVAYTFYDTDNRVRRYAETLARRGESVDMVALQHDDQPKREVLNGVTVHRIQKRALNERTKWAYLIRLSTFLLRSFFFITVNHLRKRYQLVHVHSVPDFEVFAALVPKLTGAKVILDIHDIVPEFYSSKFGTSKDGILFRMLVLVERLSCMFADHVIIANHLWERVLTRRSVKPEKCTAIINYPDTNRFHKRGEVAENRKMVLMYPGTLNYHQGVDLAVEAYAAIADKYTDLEFHIYGDGPEKGKMEKLVEERNLGKRVKFHGLVTLDEMAVKMETADIGVVPKRGEGFGDEAFSTKTMEFMVLGVPVIISRTAIDQFYFNDRIATFFNPGDIEDLSRSLVKMVSDSELRKRQSEEAALFMEKNTWSVKKFLYINIIDNLLDKP